MVLAVLAYLMGHAFKRTPAALVGVDFLAVLFLIVVILKCDQAEQRGRHMPFLAADGRLSLCASFLAARIDAAISNMSLRPLSIRGG